jgi:hypothetical protein
MSDECMEPIGLTTCGYPAGHKIHNDRASMSFHPFRPAPASEPERATCGKATPYHLIAGASWYACVLDKGHDGECQPGGTCFKHGKYVGLTNGQVQCPRWPECVPSAPASSRSQTAGEFKTKYLAGQPLFIGVEGGQLVIRIGVDTLAFAFETGEENNPYDDSEGDFRRTWKVTDAHRFAEGVGNRLCDEEEDGSTPLTKILDEAYIRAVEDDMGVDKDGRIVTKAMNEYHGAPVVPAVNPEGDASYWRARAETAELKVLTFQGEIAKIRPVAPAGEEGTKQPARSGTATKKWEFLKLDGYTWEQKSRRVMARIADVIAQAEYGFDDEQDDEELGMMIEVAKNLSYASALAKVNLHDLAESKLTSSTRDDGRWEVIYHMPRGQTMRFNSNSGEHTARTQVRGMMAHFAGESVSEGSRTTRESNDANREVDRNVHAPCAPDEADDTGTSGDSGIANSHHCQDCGTSWTGGIEKCPTCLEGSRTTGGEQEDAAVCVTPYDVCTIPSHRAVESDLTSLRAERDRLREAAEAALLLMDELTEIGEIAGDLPLNTMNRTSGQLRAALNQAPSGEAK